MKQFFIKNVTQDPAADRNNALNLFNQLRDLVFEKIKKVGQQIIDDDFQKHDYLNRRWVQDLCDEKLITKATDKWTEEYIDHPMETMEEEFKRYWKENIEGKLDGELKTLKSRYLKIFFELFDHIKGKLNVLLS